MVGNFLSCLKGVNDPFEAQEGRWDLSRDAAVEYGHISHLRENMLLFLELRPQTWGPSQVMTGTSGTRSWGLRNVQSPCEVRRTSVDSSAVAAMAEVLIWS